MSIRKALRWTVPPLALLALAAWYASSTPVVGAQQRTSASPHVAGMVPAPGPAAFPQGAAGPDSSAAVGKFVAQKNAESARERDNFVHQGWQLVDVPPPDMRLVALDPSLLKGRERELRQQIASTVASPDEARNLAQIAREASEEPTQVAAVEALGRIHSDEAQDRLLDLLHVLPDGTMARREIAPLLRPRDLSDPRAATLAQLLDSSELNPVERKQIAFTLALVGLRDRSELPASATDKLSGDSRALLASMTSLAQFKR